MGTVLVVIGVLIIASYLLVAFWALGFLTARATRAVCLACFRWDLARHRPRTCKYCGYDKRRTRDSLRVSEQPLPADSSLLRWRLFRRLLLGKGF